MRGQPTIWLLTGATGFVGKVMLDELMRRREELAVERVLVLIRPKGRTTAAERFQKEVVRAACFAALPNDWSERVTVLDGNLSTPDLGLSASDLALLHTATHVVHSAASVAFNLPVRDAARANIHTSLNLLELARGCRNLERFVYVSTAYVAPHPGEHVSVPESLVPLPAPASELLSRIDNGASDAELLQLTGHPNTYTLTKCIAEHLIVERRGTLPLSIVRPSIISAARALPFPGWIDSTAGFGAFVLMIGMGHMRAVIGNMDALVDVVPVDDVTSRIVYAALLDSPTVEIKHAVVGLARAPSVRECREEMQRWFRIHRTGRRTSIKYLGGAGVGYRLADLWHHRLPSTIGSLRSDRKKRRAQKLTARLDHLNEVFPYFTSRSFDFQTSMPMPASHSPRAYLACICRGVYRHLLKHDDREWAMAGRAHPGHDGDLRWAFGQSHGNAWIRSASWIVTKVLRRTTESVTVDLPSFERARDNIPPGAAIVLVPSHRSYLDFVLCSYLAFARPDLGVPIPHIAATMEFGKIPLLGRMLAAMHAFYLRRGQGKEDPELTMRVQAILRSGKALEFFVEGARSRSREFLPPKRGLLRCLQASGIPTALIPIAISYDRMPEEAAFAHELSGGAKPPMRLSDLLGWSWRAYRGDVSLGRIHIAAGAVVTLDEHSSVPAVAEAVVEELRAAMAVTDFHLEAYLAHHPIDGHDAASLKQLIESGGRRVLASGLRPDETLSPHISRTMAEHFTGHLPPALTQQRPLVLVADSDQLLEVGG